MDPHNDSERRTLHHAVNHVVLEGVLVVLLTAAQIFMLRGFDRELLFFCVPPVIAFVIRQKIDDSLVRGLAAAFLIAIAVGTIVAEIPWLFPNMRWGDQRLPAPVNRLLNWYIAVYMLGGVVVPQAVFWRMLGEHRRGEPAPFSPFICRLGIATSAFVGLILVIGGASLLGLIEP